MKTFLDIVEQYIKPDPDAMLWVLGYATYVHAIDDIIDNDVPDDQHRQQFILKTFEFAEAIYSNIFYLRHISMLRPLIKSTSQAYMDSVLWEKSPEDWKRKVADAARQQGNDILLAIIEIVGGIEKRHEASLLLREVSYKMHHLKDGTPC